MKAHLWGYTYVKSYVLQIAPILVDKKEVELPNCI